MYIASSVISSSWDSLIESLQNFFVDTFCKSFSVFLAHSDSCPITQVQYLNTHELCTTNTVGQLRIWDVRSPTDAPTRVMSSSETLVALRCVDQHPTQSYILASGGSDGCVTLFDIRKECSPLTKLQIHDEDSEFKFIWICVLSKTLFS